MLIAVPQNCLAMHYLSSSDRWATLIQIEMARPTAAFTAKPALPAGKRAPTAAANRRTCRGNMLPQPVWIGSGVLELHSVTQHQGAGHAAGA